MHYDIVIGLEVHAELDTQSKVFCSCSAKSFSSVPNTCCCPVCVGMPGALPVLNQKAVDLTMRAGYCIGAKINEEVVFERKNYFYPDLSKAYQISQLVKPICVGGSITLKSGKVVPINRIHLEEDAGKLIHSESVSVVDYNRGGVPLIELVTELPGVSCADEAIEFLETLRQRYIFAGVAKCRMEEGGMRCDVNVSVKPAGSKTYGTRTEMKNLNSFKAVHRAILFESARQIAELEAGKSIKQETRKWDDEKGKSFSMRSKEEAQDYRYFPDPDLLTVRIPKEVIEQVGKEMPKLPHVLREQFINDYKLTPYEADVLLSDKEQTDFYLSCTALYHDQKKICTWLLNDLAGIKKELTEIHITPAFFTDIIKLVESEKITRVNGVDLLKQVAQTGENPNDLAKAKGLFDTVDTKVIEAIIKNLMAQNANLIADYKQKPGRVSPFVIGQVMKQTGGKAKAPDVIRILGECMK